MARKLDWAILNADSDADPAGPDGLFTTDGVLAFDYQGSALASVKRAITRLEVAGVTPTTIVLGPHGSDTTERPTFAGRYGTAVARLLFDLPVVVSDQVREDVAVVADWSVMLVVLRNSVDVSWWDADTTEAAA